MVRANKRWSRWAAPRSDVVRTTELAADVLTSVSGYPSTVNLTLADADGFTEETEGLTALERLHPHDLARLRTVRITVRPDRAAWRKAVAERPSTEDTPPIPSEEVVIRLTNYGTTLDVEGDDRTQVQGLLQRLTRELGRGGTAISFDRDLLFLAGPFLAAVLVLAFLAAVHTLKLAHVNDRWEPAEIVGIALGIVLGLGAAGAVWWLVPPLELLGEGSASRLRRFRGRLAGAFAAVVLALLASYVYGWIHPH
jgi:hypothetical protein